MAQRFIIQSAGGLLRQIERPDGRWAPHPIAARWFDSFDAADAVMRRQLSRTPCAVRQLDDSCNRVLGEA